MVRQKQGGKSREYGREHVCMYIHQCGQGGKGFPGHRPPDASGMKRIGAGRGCLTHLKPGLRVSHLPGSVSANAYIPSFGFFSFSFRLLTGFVPCDVEMLKQNDRQPSGSTEAAPVGRWGNTGTHLSAARPPKVTFEGSDQIVRLPTPDTAIINICTCNPRCSRATATASRSNRPHATIQGFNRSRH